MKTRNRRYPRSSGINGNKSRESGAFLSSRRVPDFCNDRRSFPTNGNSNLSVPSGTSAIDFAHYQSTKLLKCCYICVPFSIFGALSISRQIHNRKSGKGPSLANIRYIRKIWDGLQKVKFPIVWDFPDIWNPGLTVITDHFTVVCSVTRPLNGSEAGGNLVLIQT